MTRDELAEHLIGEGLSARTVAVYCSLYDRLELRAAELGLDLEALTARETRELADLFPNTSSTRYQLRSTLMYVWEAAERPDGPLKAVRVPRRPRMHCRALSAAEAATLAAAALERTDRMGLAVCFALYEALRRSEIAGLRWES